MTSTYYDPDAPQERRRTRAQGIIYRLAHQLREAREGSAEYKMIERCQMEGIRRGSELGGLLMQEYDMSGISAVNHW